MSENKIDRTGGQAFPQLKHLQKYDSEHGVQRYDAETIAGMTVRQLYAGLALSGLLANPKTAERPEILPMLGLAAVAAADNLIKAEKESQE